MPPTVPFNAEFYYALIGVGICVPVFVHYAARFIRNNWHSIRPELDHMTLATKKDWSRTKMMFRRLLNGH